MTLWLLAVIPIRFPAATRSSDHPRAGVGLAGPRRALDGERRASSTVARRRAAVRPSSPSRRSGAMSACPVRGGRLIRRSRAARCGPSASRPWSAHPLTEPQECIFAERRSRTRRRDDRGGVQRLAPACFRSIVQLMSSMATTSPAALAGRRVLDAAADLDVVLLAREAGSGTPSTASRSRRSASNARPAERLVGLDRAPHRSSRSSGGSRATRRSCSRADARTGAGPAASALAPRASGRHRAASPASRSARSATTACRAFSSGLGVGSPSVLRGTTWPVCAGELVAALLEPVPQPRGAHHVVAVVALDPFEVIRARPLALAQLEPLLEGDDARGRVAEVDVPHEPVERLELLDPVALDRGANAWRDDPVEVDHGPAAEQAVDLVLAGGVTAHQPLQGRRLVRREVVDVRSGYCHEPGHEEVHDLLEGALLAGRAERRRSSSTDQIGVPAFRPGP